MRIAGTLLRDIIYGAVQAGAALPELLAAAGLPPDDLQASASRRYDLHTVDAVWRAALQHSQDPLLGLHTGAQVHFEAIGVVGFTMQNSPDLGTALARGAHYASLYSQLLPIRLAAAPAGGAVVCFEPLPVFADACPVAARQGVESSMAFVAQAARKLTGYNVWPSAVGLAFAAPPPGQRRDYEAVFGQLPVFEAPGNTLAFAAADLGRPVVSYNAALFELLNQEASRALLAQQQATSFREQLRGVLAELLRTRFPSVSDAARALGVSTRTLIGLTQRGLFSAPAGRHIGRNWLKSNN
jgi:hypothetical protein